MTYYTSGEFAKMAHVSIPGGAKRGAGALL